MTQIGKFMGSFFDEKERMRRFKEVCPSEFFQKIDLTKIKNATAFAKVVSWSGQFPGPLAYGPTGTGKTRSAWSVLGRLWVREGKAFRWYSAKRLTDSFFEYHMEGRPEAFWRGLGGVNLILLDDMDKMESSERNNTVLFELYDWLTREQHPAITTTNQGQDWWANRMGEAFARRMFEGAHQPVKF